MIKKVYKNDLSDLDIDSLPDGFAIVFDQEDRPVAAVLRYDYYQRISQLIGKVKEYVSKAKPKVKK